MAALTHIQNVPFWDRTFADLNYAGVGNWNLDSSMGLCSDGDNGAQCTNENAVSNTETAQPVGAPAGSPVYGAVGTRGTNDDGVGLAGWAIALIVLSCLFLLCSIAYCVFAWCNARDDDEYKNEIHNDIHFNGGKSVDSRRGGNPDETRMVLAEPVVPMIEDQSYMYTDDGQTYENTKKSNRKSRNFNIRDPSVHYAGDEDRPDPKGDTASMTGLSRTYKDEPSARPKRDPTMYVNGQSRDPTMYFEGQEDPTMYVDGQRDPTMYDNSAADPWDGIASEQGNGHSEQGHSDPYYRMSGIDEDGEQYSEADFVSYEDGSIGSAAPPEQSKKSKKSKKSKR